MGIPTELLYQQVAVAVPLLSESVIVHTELYRHHLIGGKTGAG